MTFKELIGKHGFNLASLAKKLGLNKATTYYWVDNHTVPRYETLEQLSALLGESIETIVAALQNK
jgi:transcriptional regulator with XRE-family HTH domain